MEYGPAYGDSATTDQVMKGWKELHEEYSAMSAEFVSNSWRVTEGEYKGDWVAQWGEWKAHHKKFDKDIIVPYHLIVRIDDGKIGVSFNYHDDQGAIKQLGGKVAINMSPRRGFQSFWECSLLLTCHPAGVRREWTGNFFYPN
jgi:hypothetical protein